MSIDRLANHEDTYAAFYDKKAINSIRKKLTTVMFELQEHAVLHTTIQWEQNVYEAVKAGSDAIRLLLEQEFDGKNGKLSENSLRDFKNNCICTICVLTRQILHDHLLDLEHAFSLSDACIQCIESCTTETECIQVTIAGMEEFSSQLEQSSKKGYHHLVKSAVEYIFKNLHSKLKLNDIAKHIGTNASYLARIFHQYEGLTIHQYILKEKINRAKNMLQYSEYKNDEISHYLGFCSQSHLGTVFKKATHMTLNEYRLLHNESYRKGF